MLVVIAIISLVMGIGAYLIIKIRSDDAININTIKAALTTARFRAMQDRRKTLLLFEANILILYHQVSPEESAFPLYNHLKGTTDAAFMLTKNFKPTTLETLPPDLSFGFMFSDIGVPMRSIALLQNDEGRTAIIDPTVFAVEIDDEIIALNRYTGELIKYFEK